MKVEEGKYYHLFNRGNNRENIFFDEENFIFFLKQFKNYMLPCIDVFAYCLMPNHFHLFIRVNDVSAFQKGIRNFLISYSKAINKKYDRVGSLFQGRYKISEIISDSYYTRIVTYIHQNPLTANLVNDLRDYKYSSYPAYLSDKQTMLTRSEVLDWFGGVEGFKTDHKIIQALTV